MHQVIMSILSKNAWRWGASHILLGGGNCIKIFCMAPKGLMIDKIWYQEGSEYNVF